MWTAVELRELRIFLALAEELHFSRTAKRLQISQPGVSEAIRSLEVHLRGRLFDRTSRQVRLTPAGEELQRTIAPIMEELQRALAHVNDIAAGVGGLLRVGFTSTTDGPALSRLVEEPSAGRSLPSGVTRPCVLPRRWPALAGGRPAPPPPAQIRR